MSTTMPKQTPPKIAPFTPDFVKGVCDVLSQTDHPGLTGSEIDSLLQMVGVRPVSYTHLTLPTTPYV